MEAKDERDTVEFNQKVQKCGEKIPRNWGKKFLAAKRRQNGSPALGVGFRRREREQMPAVSSLNPAFLSLAFACNLRLRDLSMASRYNGEEDHQKLKKESKRMCSGNQIDIVCDVKRLMFIEIIYWNIWLYSMVIIPGTAVTIGATLSMWQALLDFCLLFYAKKILPKCNLVHSSLFRSCLFDYIYNHKKYFHNTKSTYFKTIYVCKYCSFSWNWLAYFFLLLEHTFDQRFFFDLKLTKQSNFQP